MVQLRAILRVADNSGAKTIKCIKVLGGFKRKQAKLGDIVVISVQKLRKKLKDKSKVKKKEVHRAIIIRTKVKNCTRSGLGTVFSENSAILVTKQENPIGTRIIGSFPRLLRKKKLQKLASISAGLA